MRIRCPNCAAEYEIDATLIPDEGREVQCSACSHTWFEVRDTPDDRMAGDTTPPEAAAGTPRPRRELDEATRRILREEAAHEAEQRRRAAKAPSGGSVTTHPSDARTETVARSDAGTDMANPAGADRDPRAALRNDTLPDVDRIGSSLDAKSDAGDRDAGTGAPAPARRTKGFGRGFFLVLALAALAMIAYVAASTIVAALPVLGPALAAYVDAVNDLRGLPDGWFGN